MRILSIASKAILASVLAATGVAAAPAYAENYQTRLTAFVPTSCSADIVGSFSQVGSDSYTLGSINQYCNTRFQLSLSHGAIAQTGQLSFGGALVTSGSDATILKSMANPVANGSDELVIYGFNAAQADEFRTTLTVTVSPIAF
ncbi:MAG: hypothetical protein ABI668_12430 [Sphingorhabdus sp.]